MHVPDTDDAPAAARVPADWAATLIRSRQTVLPRRLGAPGPDARELALIVEAAAQAPDHDQILPWRFVQVPEAGRAALAGAFEQSLAERDPQATEAQRAQAREKAFRAPCLMLAIARLQAGDAPDAEATREVTDAERLVSAGCAIQNMLLMATALGYGSALTSGKALQARPLRALFGLGEGEVALCFISVGTPTQRRPGRLRPAPARYFSVLEVPR